MWTSGIMRYFLIPAIFFAVGPPAGALAILALPILGMLGSWEAAPSLLLILPAAFVFSYLFGGLQALLVGLVAGLSVRWGGRVRTLPVLLAALAVGAALSHGPMLFGEGLIETAPSPAIFVGLHLVGAIAGLAVCRWMEGAARPPINPG